MQKKILAAILMLTVTLLVSACQSLSTQSENSENSNQQTTFSLPPELLGHGARLPTEEELKQEQAFIDERVRSAIEQLKSHDVHQRIVATETLNAYRTFESERQLSETMLHDDNAQVRQTAAQGLNLFQNLSEHTVYSLFKALRDKDKQTGKESLNTLLNYTLRISDTDKFQSMLKKLQHEARANHKNLSVRAELKAFIKDQEPIRNSNFTPPVNP
ncbi:MAG: hypothetical protein ACXWF8_00610 [Methylobacter sp.]